MATVKKVWYTAEPNQVMIQTADDMVWTDELTNPADNEIRKALNEWLDAGNTITPYVAPPKPVPTNIGKLYFIRALRELNLKTLFDTIMANASTEIKEDYSVTTRIVRDDPMTVAFEQAAATQGVTKQQVDQIFITACDMENGDA